MDKTFIYIYVTNLFCAELSMNINVYELICTKRSRHICNECKIFIGYDSNSEGASRCYSLMLKEKLRKLSSSS